MEDLLVNFGSVEVTTHPNNPNAEHPRFCLYKAKYSGSSQDERRKRVLEARREARYDLLTHLRSIEETQQSENDSSDDMECDQDRIGYKRPKKYKGFLMLSEWLVDVPSDFQTAYLTVPCPVGKRSLVVSAKGKTRVYTKSGYQVNQFPSLLPGGCRQNFRTGYAVLDCIWSECNKTFYVIDLMCWVNQAVIECDTVFRFEWAKSRLEEDAVEISKVSKYNPLRFVRLPYYDSSRETLTNLFTKGEMPFSVELDGILFYNRETHYTHGPTPLVGWLKAYMLPEILNIPVADKFMEDRPEKYVSLPVHIQHAIDMRSKPKEKMVVTQDKKDKIISAATTPEKAEEEMESNVS